MVNKSITITKKDNVIDYRLYEVTLELKRVSNPLFDEHSIEHKVIHVVAKDIDTMVDSAINCGWGSLLPGESTPRDIRVASYRVIPFII